MTNTTHQLCDTIILDQTFLTLIIINSITSSISFFSNSFIFYLFLYSHSFHSNVRLLLKNFAFSSSILALAYFARNVHNFYIYFNGLNEIRAFACELTEIVWVLSVASATFSITFIGLERVWTTIWKRKFGDYDHPSIIAYTMTGLAWLGGFGIISVLLLTTFYENETICYCQSILAAPKYTQIALGPVFFLINLSTILCYLFLYRHSRTTYLDFTINTTQHSLAHRHQLLNNMETTTVLAPSMLIHGTAYILGSISFTSVRCLISDIKLSITCFMIIITLAILETGVHPILLLIKHRKLRKLALEHFQILKFVFERKYETTMVRVVSNENRPSGDRMDKPLRSRIKTGVVEFRVKPEQHENILNTLWDSKSRNQM